ncbi:hypothetical protein KQX54_003446 [Cotesia glomerata]|uniref:Uncharacterized protein n=1 Tax=Cotesia glomerata TaxID=32391 RepID=A0AAV7I582_COTGL|nr:hypothetical protein KQX54_003446 [Cotesia glomerata]
MRPKMRMRSRTDQRARRRADYVARYHFLLQVSAGQCLVPARGCNESSLSFNRTILWPTDSRISGPSVDTVLKAYFKSPFGNY